MPEAKHAEMIKFGKEPSGKPGLGGVVKAKMSLKAFTKRAKEKRQEEGAVAKPPADLEAADPAASNAV